MVHPALVDEKLKKLTQITDISRQEYNVLMSFSLRDECQKRGIEFIHYGDLRRITRDPVALMVDKLIIP